MYKLRIFVLAFILMSLCVFIKAQTRVVCIGNSITEGFGLTTPATQAYPAQLQALLGVNYSVLNCGVSARTLLKKGDIPYWNESKFTDAKNFDPQIVIISLGTNDSKPKNWDLHRNEFFSDYKDMVNAFRTNGKTPTIYVCFPPPAFYDNYEIRDLIIRNEIITLVDSVRKTLGTLNIDFYHQLLPYGGFFADGIHPNVDGAAVMAQIAYNAVKGCTPITPYISINNTDSTKTSSATIKADDNISLRPQPEDGTWSWKGPNTFTSSSRIISFEKIQLNQGGIYTATYISPEGCKYVQNFSVTINGCTPSVIKPFLQVDGGTWQAAASVSIKAGSNLSIGPQSDNGTWTWTGPNKFYYSNTRQLGLVSIVNKQAGDYTVTLTNDGGCKTSQTFSINVTGDDKCTPAVVPYSIVNNQSWKQDTLVTMKEGDNISFGPQPLVDSPWSWTGPNNFACGTRDFTINKIKTNQSGTYYASFTNIIGCKATVKIRVIVNANTTNIIDAININGVITYPNPVKDIATIINLPVNTKISVYDLAGKNLISTKSFNENGEVKIDLSNFLAGTYLLKIGNEDAKTVRIVKL